jgi:hypothetical protein
MRRFGLLGLGMGSVMALGAVMAQPVMAAPLCLQVKTKATGIYEDAKCEKEATKGEYVLAKVVTKLESGIWCAKLDNGSTIGDYSSSTCGTETEKGQYILVRVEEPLNPEFKPVGGLFTGTGGASLLQWKNGTEDVHCGANTISGTVSSATLAGGVVVKFTECTSTGPTKAGCSVGTITTTTLHGILGTALPSPRAGLLLLPATGKIWFTLLENGCTVESSMVGNVAGLIEPTRISQTTGKLIFNVVGGRQEVADFDPTTGGLVTPGLTLFGSSASLAATESLTYSVALEVT